MQTAYAWMIALVVHLSVDAFYILRRGNTPTWWQAGLVAGLGMALIGLPMIQWLYPNPEISLGNLPLLVLGGFAGALLASWFAQALGDSIAESPRFLAEDAPKWRLAGLTSIVLMAVLIFFSWFVLTATSPVL